MASAPSSKDDPPERTPNDNNNKSSNFNAPENMIIDKQQPPLKKKEAEHSAGEDCKEKIADPPKKKFKHDNKAVDFTRKYSILPKQPSPSIPPTSVASATPSSTTTTTRRIIADAVVPTEEDRSDSTVSWFIKEIAKQDESLVKSADVGQEKPSEPSSQSQKVVAPEVSSASEKKLKCTSEELSQMIRALPDETNFSDVNKERAYFIIGQAKEVFLERKSMFCDKSDVFRAMFYGELHETGPVIMPDIEPDAFKILLKYLDDDHVRFANIDQATSLCNIAEKYNLAALKEKCSEYMFPITIDEMWHSLDCGCLFNIPMLKDASLNIVRSRTSHVLSSRQISLLSKDSLRLIVKDDHLDIRSELEVINAVVYWAKYRCCVTDKDVNRENIRDALGNILHRIRFLTMSPKQITKLGTYLLMPEEVSKIMKVFEEQENPDSIKPLCTSTKKRHKFFRDTPYINVPVQSIFFPNSRVAQFQPFEFSSTERKSIRTDFVFSESVEITAVIVPSRINKSEDDDRYYFEDMTVNIVGIENTIIATGKFRGRTEYNKEIKILLFDRNTLANRCATCSYSNRPTPPIVYSPPYSPAYYPTSPSYRPFGYCCKSLTIEVIFNKEETGYYPWHLCNYSSTRIISSRGRHGFIIGFSYYCNDK